VSGDPDTTIRFFKTMFGPYCADPDHVNRIDFRASAEANRNWTRTYAIFRENFFSKSFDFHSRLNLLSCETLIVTGGRDLILPYTSECLHKSIPGSKLAVIENCGHFPFAEKPDELFQIVNGFLNKSDEKIMASKEYETLLEQLQKRPSYAHLPIKEIREGFEKFLSVYPPESDIVFEPFSIGQIPAWRAIAPGADKNKAILFLHGGGFNAGSVHSHRDLMGRISRASGVAVLGIGYRLAPEHPFPAALEDALQGYRWLLDRTDRIAIVGASAGGGLALSLCFKLKEENLPQPACAVCISPWTDLAFSTDSIHRNKGKDFISVDRLKNAAKDYCHKKDPKDPRISPLYGDFHGLPPLFVQLGSFEILRDEGAAVVENAIRDGVDAKLDEWPEMVHTWQLFAAKIPEGREAIERIGQFLKHHL